MGADEETGGNKKNEVKEVVKIKKPEDNESNKFGSSTTTNIIKKDFKCTYDKNELLNKMNNFVNQHVIQTKFFEKKNNIYDPVFKSIQKEEKDGLI